MKKIFWAGFTVGTLVMILVVGVVFVLAKEVWQSFLDAGISNQVISILILLGFSGVMTGFTGLYLYEEIEELKFRIRSRR